MKKTVAFISLLITCVALFAQSVPTFPYQAVVRNSQNQLIKDSTFAIDVEVYQATELKYKETQNVTTNANGQFAMNIGGGTVVSGALNDVTDWSVGKFKMTYHLSGGDIVSEDVVHPVPYTLQAGNAGERQVLSLSNDTIYLTGGSYVKLPDYVLRAVMNNRITDTLNDYSTADQLCNVVNACDFSTNVTLVAVLDEMSHTLDSLNHLADSLSNLPHGGDTIIAITDTIAFLPNGGQGTMDTMFVTRGNTVLNANAYTHDGNWQFLGWNTETDGSGTSYTNQAAVTTNGNLTLYAQWHTWCTGTPQANEQGTSRIDSVKDVDNNQYAVVQIGNQCWLKENLRTSNIIYSIGNVYTNPAEGYDVNTYGRLYDWAAVMQGASSSSSNPSGVQGICPTGWHVPSDAEWKQMEIAVGMSQNAADSIGWRGNIVAKISSNTGWTFSDIANAAGNTLAENRNVSGFSVLPAGFYSGSYDVFGNSANFWVATDSTASQAFYRAITYRRASINRYASDKSGGLSVRCVRNVEVEPCTPTSSSHNIEITTSQLPYPFGTDTTFLAGTTTGTYILHRTNAAGCDSTITINLTVNGFAITDTIAFLPNGGQGTMNTMFVTRGDTVLNANTYTHSGNWQFLGWNTEADGSGTSYANQAAVTTNGNLTLYAQWHTWCTGTPLNNELGTSRIDSVKDAQNNWYKVVQIDNQCWLKENLRTTTAIGTTYNPADNADNVPTYGLLYNWTAVMQGASSSSSNPSNVQGICPDGWHVPSDAEWAQLTNYVFYSTDPEYKCGDNCGSLQTQNNVPCIANALSDITGWIDTHECAAGHSSSATINTTGFSAVPAGNCLNGYPNYFGGGASFWSATRNDTISSCWCWGLSCVLSRVMRFGVLIDSIGMDYGLSVRCVRGMAPVSVTTDSAATVTNNSATLYGIVTSLGGNDEVTAGFRYGQHPDYMTFRTESTVAATGSYNAVLTNISPNTTYFFQAYAATATDTAWAADTLTFTTLTNPCSVVSLRAGTALVGGKFANKEYGSDRKMDSVSDHEGNVYRVVEIGRQCWLAENMRATTSPRQGTVDLQEGTALTYYNPKYYKPSDDTLFTLRERGYLYNWVAAMDTMYTTHTQPQAVNFPGRRGICPEGWHLPTDDEWFALEKNVLTDFDFADAAASGTGYRGKGAGQFTGGHQWTGTGNSTTPNSYSYAERNSTGFSALPVGYYTGNFTDVGLHTAFHCATSYNDDNAWIRHLYYTKESSARNNSYKDYGQSVRCVRNMDPMSATTDSAASVTNNSANLYGNVTSLADNDEVTAGFRYGQHPDYMTLKAETTVSATGSYNAELTNISPNTTYYFQAYAATATDTVWADNTLTFTTLTNPCSVVSLRAGTALVGGKFANKEYGSDRKMDSVSDHEGNVYRTVQIGRQCWLAENMRATIEPDGGTIVLNADSSSNTTPMAYSSDVTRYGYLYNFAAAMNIDNDATEFNSPHRGICPEGWHIPTDDEWTTLANEAGVGIGSGTGAGKLAGGNNWNVNNAATYPGNYLYAERNSTGFSALPAGNCFGYGANSVGDYASFWSATPAGNTTAYRLHLYYARVYITESSYFRGDGYSVRCVRDGEVITDSATAVNTTSATLHGTLMGMPDETSTTVGFRYGNQSDSLNTTVTTTATTTGPFSCNINNLTRATLYYYQAFETNGTDTLFGAMNNFLTLPEPCPGMPTVTDHEGNVYHTVQIGSQCWTAENMRATTEPDGGTIVLNDDDYSYIRPMAYSSDVARYGYLYNFPAAMNIASNTTDFSYPHRGICPEGWHIPTNEEWTALANEAGVGINSGTGAGKLTVGNNWRTHNAGTAPGNYAYADRNNTGFSALPAGYGFEDVIYSVGYGAYFWSATSDGDDDAYCWNLYYENEYISEFSDYRYYGNSVRCVYDGVVSTGSADNITPNSATLHGNLMEMLDETSVTVGFRYGTQSDSLTATVTTAATAVGPFNCNIANLSYNTTYYYQAFATDGTDTLWGGTNHFLSLPKPCPGMPTVADHEGNVYPTVQIGSQCWTAENMRATTEPDGGSIVLNDDDYSYIRPMAYSSNVARYGYLYNFAAAMNIDDYDTTFTHPHRGICPVGWHIPTNDEWTALANEAGVGIGYSGTGAGKLTGGNNWYSGDYDYATYPGNHDYAERNSTGFSALPAGWGDEDGVSDVGYESYFWSATPDEGSAAYCWNLYYAYEYINTPSSSRYYGQSVRCVRDAAVTTGSADNITTNSATLHGTLMEMLDETSVTVGFRYGTQSDSLNATVTTTATAVGPFICDIHNLTRNTTYYYQAFETDGTDTLWGTTTQSFTAEFSPCYGATTVTDHEDNVYRIVAIGSQCWMAENMRATTEPDGSTIVRNADSTSYTKPMAYSSDVDKYGYLYNFAAAMNIDDDQTDFAPFHRGICPEGWHIPTNEEWTDMANAAGVGIGRGTGAGKLAYGNDWDDYYDYATYPGNHDYAERNSTGFSALPAGYGYGDEYDGADAYDVGYYANFWSATPNGDGSAYCWYLYYYYEYISEYSDSRYYGYSVRCVRNGAVTTGSADNITPNSATLHGTLMEMLDETSVTVGFRYGTHRDNLTATVTTTATAVGPFSSNIASLNYNTTYYYQAFATDGTDTLFGITNNFFTFPEPCPDMPTATDHEGNVYHTVQIGSQCWMAENMRATTEPDGGSIVRNADSTSNTTPMAYSSDVDRYGYLYNFAAAMNIDDYDTTFTHPHRGICPEGWHIPTNKEWTDLANEAGVGINGGTDAGKLVVSEDWDAYYYYTTCPGNYDYAERNSTGFSALPAGYGNSSGAHSVGNYTYFWSATPNGTTGAYSWYLGYDYEYINKYADSLYYGNSVRCVHDVPPVDTIAFVPNGGIGTIDTTLVERDEEVTIPANTYTHDGNWQFTGWNTEANGSGTPYAVNATFTANGNLTLYAQWSTWCAGTPLNNELGTSRIDSVKDHENNWYKVVQIGSQCWLKENMRATTEPGGSAIVLNADSASNTTPMAYSSNVAQYGYLYNFPATMNTTSESSNLAYPHRGICPEGWHVPTNDDWTALANEAGVGINGGTGAGKLVIGEDWDDAYDYATYPGNYEYAERNSTGFSALPAGYGDDDGVSDVGYEAYFWSATPDGDGSAYCWNLYYAYEYINTPSNSRYYGNSVRCVRDAAVTTDSVDNITTNSATLHGTLHDMGEESSSTVGFRYGTNRNGLNATVTATATAVGSFSCNIANLTPKATYYYQAFETDGTDTVWSFTRDFLTFPEPCPDMPTVSDHEGNVYHTVKIGSQCWMAENMRAATEPDGGTIVLNADSISNTTPMAYSSDVDKYGYLYNFAAAMNIDDNGTAFSYPHRGICPEGWHIPTNDDWTTLADTAGVGIDEGTGAGKLVGGADWNANNAATSPGNYDYADRNNTGFSALPAGWGDEDGANNVGYGAYFWSATPDGNNEANIWNLNYDYKYISNYSGSRSYVRSVRCLRNAAVTTDSVDNITHTSATLHGTLTEMPDETSSTVGFRYGIHSDSLTATVTTTATAAGPFSCDIHDLTRATLYYYQAFETNGTDTLFGETNNFLTLPEPCPGMPTVADHEGNIYRTVQIGSQCWMAENMRATTEPNGRTIVLNDDDYSYIRPMAYSSDVARYGYLYNFPAAMNIASNTTDFSYPHRGICPEGWHIPTNEEWTTLANEAGVGINSGTGAGKLTFGNNWRTHNAATAPGNYAYADRNNTGFSALPAGYGYEDVIYYVGDYTYFWSATPDGDDDAYDWELYYDYEYISEVSDSRYYGLSVRCVYDGVVSTGSADNITPNSATLHGNLMEMLDETSVTVGFRYGTQSDSLTATVTTTATAAGPFSCNINNLTHNTTYYFQAFETNGTDTLWGGTNHFLTLPKPCPGMPTVTDHEGNVYPTVQIGSQCWTAENMRATTEPDGGTIVLNDDDHSNTEPMAYSSNVARYGYLYNFPAAMNIDDYDTTFTHPHRGICPVGWHIPTNDEWTALANEAGVGINSGTGAGKLTVGNNWYSGDNDYATYPGNHDYAERNSTGFSALPAGYGYDDGVSDVGYDAYFWSATPNVYNEAYIWDLYYAYEYIYKYSGSRYYGRSVRCVLDEGVKVYTGIADNITPNSATLHGNLMEMLDETSVTVGFRYGTQSDSLTATVTTTATAAGPFSCDIHNLTRNTTYYYQAFATDGTDTLWGTTQSFTAQFNPCSGASTVTDHEDNVYRTVAIGSQCWMAENMRAITEPDGSSIVRNADSTSNTTPMAYSSDVDKYGYLYNFAAAMNIADSSTTFTYPHRGICPEGWHIPTNKEWTDLANAAGVGINGGTGAGKLVYGNDWDDDDYYDYATYPGNYYYAERNSTGFSALPAGYGNSSGANSVGYYTYFWSATPNGTTGAYSWYLGYDYEYINKYADSRYYGNSVRCVRDAAVTTDSVDNITHTSATLHGTLHDMGEESSSTVGFRYGTRRDNLNTTVTTTATAAGPFNCTISNLNRTSIYYYKTFKINGSDTLWGLTKDFRTLSEPCPGMPTVTDHEGNVYPTVQIGSQCWMAENMRATTEPDGSTIVLNDDDYSYTTPMAYSSDVDKYGYLYNFAAAMNIENDDTTFSYPHRGICPEGWHIPTNDEWTALANEAGVGINGGTDAGKLVVSEDWDAYYYYTTCPGNYDYAERNVTGFSALPAGYGDYDGANSVGDYAYFWSATPDGNYDAYFWNLNYDNEYIRKSSNSRSYGFSVRCVLDGKPVDTIAFIPNGGIGTIDTTLVERDEEVTIPANTYTHDGNWQFTGWNTEANGSGTPYAVNATFTANGNLTLYAQWSTWCAGTPLNNELGNSRIDSVKDHENNWYKVVQIGSQCWLKENMRATTEPGGSAIVLNADSASNTTPMAYSSNVAQYGYLYNFPAAMNTTSESSNFTYPHRGICPEGWHVPTNDDWALLAATANVPDYLYVPGTTEFTNGLGKLTAGTDWMPSSWGTSPGYYNYIYRDSTGFSARPAGCYYDGSLDNVGESAYFWTSSEYDYYLHLFHSYGAISWGSGELHSTGYSVRCVRNTLSAATDSATAVTTSSAILNGTIFSLGDYNTAKAGFQYGTSSNAMNARVEKTENVGVGPYNCAISGLTANTTYFYKSFVVGGSSTDTVWAADTLYFTTLSENPCLEAPTVTDADGNVYNTVKIGRQCWMAQNLRTETKRNGQGNIYNLRESSMLGAEGYDVATYGLMYDWAAVMQSAESSTTAPSGVQGICPDGWHVPSSAEWDTLTQYVFSNDAYKCGCSSTQWEQNTPCIANALAAGIWDSPESCCAGDVAAANFNQTGFSALPAGYNAGSYFGFGIETGFWSATADNTPQEYPENEEALCRFLSRFDSEVTSSKRSKQDAYSVRCVRNVPTISFHPNGGQGRLDTIFVTDGNTVLAANTYIHGGNWRFEGWNTEPDGSGTHYDDQAAIVVEDDLTLYAQWHTWCSSTSQNNQATTRIDSVKDHENNWYKVVQIGNQCWLKENMRATTEPGGGNIVLNADSASNTTPMAYSVDVAKYGYLYNFPAIMNITDGQLEFNYPHRGICPDGWHIPTDEEWITMFNTASVSSRLDGTGVGKLAGGNDWEKAKDATYPGNYNYAERDSTGFSALPAGFYYNETYNNVNKFACFWTSSPWNESYVINWNISKSTEYLIKSGDLRSSGFSVRCVRSGMSVVTDTIAFCPNGGQGTMDTMSVIRGTTVLSANAYTHGGNWRFDGWNTEPDGSGIHYTDQDTITTSGNLTLFAQWRTWCTGTPLSNESGTSRIDSVKDHENNWYKVVQIGIQCWLAENMRATTEPDGSTIEQTTNTTSSTTPMARTSNVDQYGYLYNFAAAMNIDDDQTEFSYPHRGICPKGWHIPSNEEWTIMANEAGVGIGSGTGAGKLAAGNDWTTSSSYNLTHPGNLDYAERNSTGFSALPAGVSGAEGVINVGYGANFWSATSDGNTNYWSLWCANEYLSKLSRPRTTTFSVRCVRDVAVTTDSATAVTDSSATLNGTIRSLDGNDEVTAGFRYGRQPNNMTSKTESTVSATGSYQLNLTDLVPESTYYFQAYVTTSTDTIWGYTHNFVTLHNPCYGAPTVTDADGNVYNTVRLGNQCWMKENLKTTKYADGTSIDQGMTSPTPATDARWFYPQYRPELKERYGLLYNWKAVMRNSSSSSNNPSGVQGVCPIGWHVPSNAEWTQLTDYVSSQSSYCCGENTSNIAKALASTTHWSSYSGGNSDRECYPGYNSSTSNATGFSALPAGYSSCGFSACFYSAYFWSATEHNSDNTRAYYFHLRDTDAKVYHYDEEKTLNFSVRCLRDTGAVKTDSTTIVTNNHATLHGTLLKMLDETLVTVGFRYGTHRESLTATATTTANTVGPFSCRINNLDSNTLYYYQAFKANGIDTLWGEMKSFTTIISACYGLPTATDNEGNVYPTVTDHEGNVYPAVSIGSQCWMAKNMRAESEPGGSIILKNANSQSDNNRRIYSSDVDKYGYLYNFPAAMNIGDGRTEFTYPHRGICPEGWHIPTNSEWTILAEEVSVGINEGTGAGKLADGSDWENNSGCTTCPGNHGYAERNSTGFSALPAGICAWNDVYGMGAYTYFWSATPNGSYDADHWLLYATREYIERGPGHRRNGHSVRCVRD